MQRPTSLLPDPDLEEYAERIVRSFERYAKRLRPDEIGGLIDAPIESTFRGMRNLVGADSAALWVDDGSRDNLVIAFCEPGDSDLVGRGQPISEGLVSLIYASEQPICQNHVYEDERHSKQIDEAVGQKTVAMIAVPFYLGGLLRGAISVVRLEGGKGGADPEFTLEQFQQVQRGAVVTERLLNLQLTKVILGLEI